MNDIKMYETSTELKITVVGDGCVGKTCLLWSFARKTFPHNYIPTVYDNETAVRTDYNGKSYSLQLFDTGGQEELETLRICAYPDTDVIVLCFSLIRKSSKLNIKEKWILELKKHLPTTPIILVGTISDMRMNSNESGPEITSTAEGELLKKEIQAFKYIECSALMKHRVKEVFETCIEAYVSNKEKNKMGNKNSSCCCCC